MTARLGIVVVAGMTATAACELVFRPTGAAPTFDADPLAPDARVDADPDQADADPLAPDASVDAACATHACYLVGGNAADAVCLVTPVDYCNGNDFDDLDGHDICSCDEPALFVIDSVGGGGSDLVFVLQFDVSYRLVVNGVGCALTGMTCSPSGIGSCTSQSVSIWPDVPLTPGGLNDIRLYGAFDNACMSPPVYTFVYSAP
jgi:hypothetical protein